jgi:integrase
VVGVKLQGLKIAKARGKYYVYRREDGTPLLRGFEGSEDDLRKRLAMPDMLQIYNAPRRKLGRNQYAEHTLGWLVAWFTDVARNPDYAKLAATTQKEYRDRLFYLEPEFDAPLNTITQPALYEVRDRCTVEKWPAFADKMTTALSSMFRQAVKRGWMASNPALGIDRASKPNRNANREWRPEEWLLVASRAPKALLTAYMIARYVGYRSQSVVAVEWSHYQPDPRFGRCFRMSHRKNDEDNHWLPVAPVLRAYLDALPRTGDKIAMRKNGEPWATPKQLQTRSANFIASLERSGLVAPGLTLHGLRVTFAAEIKRVTGANDDQVAAALGDRDTRMGAHYTRHVEQENKLLRLYADRVRTKPDLENETAEVENTRPVDRRNA